MATPLSAAAATTRTKTHANARLPFRTVFSRRRWVLLAGHRRFAALLSLLSKFREISWGRFFPERKRGATTTTRRNILLPLTNYSFRPRSFFSWGGIFEGKRGRDKFSFLFFLLSRKGESRIENERVFRNREGDILLFFSLLPRIVFWDNVSRWETNFRMSNGHEKKDLSTTWTWKEGWKVLNTLEETFASLASSTIIIALILISYPRFGRIWNEDCKWINNGTRMKAWNPRVFCDK